MPRISATSLATRRGHLPTGGTHRGQLVAESAGYWYDARDISTGAEQTLPNRGTAGAETIQRGSTAGVDTNDPVFLPWDGEPYAYLPGAVSNYVSTPDSAALDITGDIDVRVKVKLDDWTPAAAFYLIGKSTAAGSQRSWYLVIETGGTVKIYWSTDGALPTATTQEESSVAVPFADGETGWVRVTLDVDNGAADSDCTFYTSTDGETWTQLGTVQNSGGTTSIFSSSAIVEIGSLNAGGLVAATPFYVFEAQIYDGIAGTLVADYQPNGTGASGETWTVNRSTTGLQTAFVDRPKILLDGTDDYLVMHSNTALTYQAASGQDSAFVLVQMHTTVDNDRAYSGTTGSNDGPSFRIRNSGSKWRMHSGGAVGTTSKDAVFYEGQLQCGGMVLDNGNLYAYGSRDYSLDGPNDMSSDGLITHTTAPMFGTNAHSPGGNVPEIEVMAILTFPGVALTEQQCQDLDAFLRGSYV